MNFSKLNWIALLSFLIAFPLISYADCWNKKGDLLIINNETQKPVKMIKNGVLKRCSNSEGSYQSFKKDDIFVEMSVCKKGYCDNGIKPDVIYVQIGKEKNPASILFNQKENRLCVGKKEDKYMYCWIED